MQLLPLLWQLPAIFTAVPMAARLLPFKLAARAIPLFYFIVSVVVMALPGRLCLALGAAGLISMLHVRLGENLTATDPPDMKEVANKLALAWDHIVLTLPRFLVIPVNGRNTDLTVHDGSEDGNEAYQEPPSPPEAKRASRIPAL